MNVPYDRIIYIKYQIIVLAPVRAFDMFVSPLMHRDSCLAFVLFFIWGGYI